MPAPDVRAAGVVVTRKGGDVLLVHRPRYDDWSFPKGKLERDEHPAVAAVREAAEETGLTVRLGPPLARQRYELGTGRTKSVDYWCARVVGDDDVAGYVPNAEIDAVAWVPRDEVRGRLTYDHDRDTLDRAAALGRGSRTLVVLRHAKAQARRAWAGDDEARPLSPAGAAQAQRLVPLLAAFDVTGVHTSTSVRCMETVAPYHRASGRTLTSYDALTEPGHTAAGVAALVEALRGTRDPVVLCTHRPVLPRVLDALGLPERALETAELLVVHHRRGAVVATQSLHP